MILYTASSLSSSALMGVNCPVIEILKSKVIQVILSTLENRTTA